MDDLPLLEFDPSPTAVIEPSATVGRFTVPEAVVVCFFRDAIERLAEAGEHHLLGAQRGDLVDALLVFRLVHDAVLAGVATPVRATGS